MDGKNRLHPAARKTDFLSVEFPRTDDRTLVLQRPLSIPGIFLPYLKDSKSGKQHLLTEPRKCGLDADNVAALLDQTYPLNEQEVMKMLSASGIALPHIFTDKVSYAAHFADLRHRSVRWKSVDEIVTAYSPLRDLRLRQIIECVGPTQEEATSATVDMWELPAATKRRFRGFFAGRSAPSFAPSDRGTTITLQAINEYVDPDGTRRQTIISFSGEDYSICIPDIYGRTLEPADALYAAFDIKDANPTVEDYRVVDVYDPLAEDRSPAKRLKLVQNMAEVLVDVMTMRAPKKD